MTIKIIFENGGVILRHGVNDFCTDLHNDILIIFYEDMTTEKYRAVRHIDILIDLEDSYK